eukprot:jgi/Undpi1/10659/HiC_scaffold_29.g13108.m1
MFDGITGNIGDDARKVTIGLVSEAAVIAERNSGQQKQDNRDLMFSEVCGVSKSGNVDLSVYAKCQKYDPWAYGITLGRTKVTDRRGRQGVVTDRDGMNFVVLFTGDQDGVPYSLEGVLRDADGGERVVLLEEDKLAVVTFLRR